MTPNENLAACAARALPRHQWNTLCPVPGWEGVLYYDPLDFQLDRPLRFFRRLRHRRFRADILYQLAVSTKDSTQTDRKRGSNKKPMLRRFINFRHKGKVVNLYCSQLTMLCLTGFAIADPRHHVVDHVNGNCTDDRPSNLQVITQSENLRRSPAVRENNRLSPKQRHERAARLNGGVNLLDGERRAGAHVHRAAHVPREELDHARVGRHAVFPLVVKRAFDGPNAALIERVGDEAQLLLRYAAQYCDDFSRFDAFDHARRVDHGPRLAFVMFWYYHIMPPLRLQRESFVNALERPRPDARAAAFHAT